MMDIKNNLTLTAYVQEKQAIIYHRIAERNQIFFTLLLVLVTSGYFIHLYQPEYDAPVFISLILLLSLAAVFSIWISYQSSLRSCAFVDQVESQLDLPYHLRQDVWLWSYILRAKWGLILKFILILLVSLFCLYMAGLSDKRARLEGQYLKHLDTFASLSKVSERQLYLESAKAQIIENETQIFLTQMAGILVFLFLLVTAFLLGKFVGYHSAKKELNIHGTDSTPCSRSSSSSWPYSCTRYPCGISRKISSIRGIS
jgi:hypothetical protein